MLVGSSYVRSLVVGVSALGFALGAQASPAMFDASFIFHAWGNDTSSGETSPYDANTWVAAPLGYDCQNAEKYSGNVVNTRYCEKSILRRGHPATGQGTTGTGKVSLVPGTPVPGIVVQQSALSVQLGTYARTPTYGIYTAPWAPTRTGAHTTYSEYTGMRTKHCCRGFLITFPPYIQSWTYATFVNAAGSFFAGGGAVAAGYLANGTGTTAYNNKTAATPMTAGSWLIRAGKNSFGGAMAMLGKYGAKGLFTMPGWPTPSWGVSSWAFVKPVGRLMFNTPAPDALLTPGGDPTAWMNPYTKTDRWYRTTKNGAVKVSSATGIATGTLWTTGQVGNRNMTGAYFTSHWRTGYDNRTPGGAGNIQLVTPTVTHWLSGSWVSHTAQLGILKIEIVPEPGAVLLLAAGAGVLVALLKARARG